MISISCWGMFPKPQNKYSRAWYDEQRDLKYYDALYLHGVFQRLSFGPELN
jgi:hypothetical protein